VSVPSLRSCPTRQRRRLCKSPISPRAPSSSSSALSLASWAWPSSLGVVSSPGHSIAACSGPLAETTPSTPKLEKRRSPCTEPAHSVPQPSLWTDSHRTKPTAVPTNRHLVSLAAATVTTRAVLTYPPAPTQPPPATVTSSSVPPPAPVLTPPAHNHLPSLPPQTVPVPSCPPATTRPRRPHLLPTVLQQPTSAVPPRSILRSPHASRTSTRSALAPPPAPATLLNAIMALPRPLLRASHPYHKVERICAVRPMVLGALVRSVLGVR